MTPEARARKTEYARQWRARNPEKGAAAARRWREAHPEQFRALNNARRAANPEEWVRNAKRWRKEHPAQVKANRAQWKNANPEKARLHARRAKLKKNFSLTAEAHAEMWKAQGGRCAICHAPGGDWNITKPERPRLVVDHDHATGKVRSLLCWGCNTRLAGVEDVEFRAAALAYLERHSVGG